MKLLVLLFMLSNALAQIPGIGSVAPSSGGGGGGITILSGANGHQFCGGNATCTTTAVDSTTATLIVIGCGSYGPACTTPGDSKSNTWNALTTYGTTGRFGTIYYAFAPTVGAGHTFTCNGNFPACMVSLYTGTLTTSSVLDVESGAYDGGGVVSSVTCPSLTLAGTGELIVSLWVSGGSSVSGLSVDSSLSILDTQSSASFELGSHAYIVDSSGSPISPQWSNGVSEIMVVACAAFKHP